MPDELKTECTRVHGCMSTVHITARTKAGTEDVLELLADSDAELVRGLIALLLQLFSGQKGADVLGFDVVGYFRRRGRDQHLSMGRCKRLAALVQRLRQYTADL